MIETAYKRQVALILGVLPEVAREKCFALHGGTAINLFVREMPRLSVDIDLTYVPVEDRDQSLASIGAALGRIKANIEKTVGGAQVTDRRDIGKLQITQSGVAVKLEVNLVGRGTLSAPGEMPLCLRAQEEFEVFCAIRVVPIEQLYGGKICAALDRQHPRDLFDIKYLLENEGFTDRIKRGFIFNKFKVKSRIMLKFKRSGLSVRPAAHTGNGSAKGSEFIFFDGFCGGKHFAVYFFKFFFFHKICPEIETVDALK